MGIKNRIEATNMPVDWQATHTRDVAPPNASTDWFKWSINGATLMQMIALYNEGKMGTGQVAVDRMQANFDMTQTEIDQLIEFWQGPLSAAVQGFAINTTEARRVNIATYTFVLSAYQRGVPQMFDSGSGWLYTEMGITIPDDR